MLINFASLYARYGKLLTKPRTGMRTQLGRDSRLAGLVFALALLLVGPAGWADDGRDQRGPVKLLDTVPIPPTPGNTTAGKLYSFDISWVDQTTQTLYLADRSNKVVDVLGGRMIAPVPTASSPPANGSSLPMHRAAFLVSIPQPASRSAKPLQNPATRFVRTNWPMPPVPGCCW